jgi:peptidoglycan L-alanyl-D-glutamate endopeptidase CwlK
MNPDPHFRLNGVHPRLAACVLAAAKTCAQPFIVVQGLRTQAQQDALWAQGRSKPGPVVTWVKVSNHQAAADGYGHAVDLAALDPTKAGGIDWSSSKAYDTIKAAMFAAAPACGLVLRWGADWNMNGVAREHGESDEDHFEIHSVVQET